MNLSLRIPMVVLLLFAAGCGEEEKNAVALPSGMKYIDLSEGAGEPAKMGDIVELHYTGRLRADGSKIDSSLDSNNPVAFQLGVVDKPIRGRVPGWDQGIVGMKPGGKRKLFIPPQLGYGPRGRPPAVPANAVLVYELELLRIVEPLKKDDIREGTGTATKTGDTVEVNYTGTFKANGKKFDSSFDRQKPLVFTVGKGMVIKGWDQGLVGMKVGGKRRLTIPYVLAYGEEGKPPAIPRKADLVFDIELLSIK